MYHVSAIPCGEYDFEKCTAALVAGFAPFGGFDWVKPGMKVALKVNLVASAHPDKAVSVHPVLLSALATLLADQGAHVILGDSPGGLYNKAFVSKIYRGCHMDQVANCTLNEDFSQSTAHYPEGLVCREFPYTAYLEQADVILNVCKLKTHGMMGMSAGVKNFFGTIPGTIKPEYHFQYKTQQDFANMLIDVFQYSAPMFTICDGIVAMEGNGPTSGTPRPVGTVLVSPNAHHLDLAASAIMGLTKEDVPTLEAGFQRGYLPATVEELEINGQLPHVADYQIIKSHSSLLFVGRKNTVGNRLLSKVMERVLSAHPKLAKSQCIGCEKCKNVCPAKAITMVDGKPKIDLDICIRCFCCQEFCPVGALTVGRTKLANFLTKR